MCFCCWICKLCMFQDELIVVNYKLLKCKRRTNIEYSAQLSFCEVSPKHGHSFNMKSLNIRCIIQFYCYSCCRYRALVGARKWNWYLFSGHSFITASSPMKGFPRLFFRLIFGIIFRTFSLSRCRNRIYVEKRKNLTEEKTALINYLFCVFS